jgi:hypothetical protein
VRMAVLRAFGTLQTLLDSHAKSFPDESTEANAGRMGTRSHLETIVQIRKGREEIV